MNRKLENKMLAGKIVLITGAGGGIGLEAANAFTRMGATVLIAEVNEEKGVAAANGLNAATPGSAEFYPVDLSEEPQVAALCEKIRKRHGCPDVIFHNAASVKIGSVEQTSVSDWDRGFSVNLKAPLILVKAFLPAMKRRGSGTIVFVSSSGAAPYMGAYEVFKTAQVELSNTLAMELEGTGVHVFTIGPGLVRTETAEKSIKLVAADMGIGLDEFYRMNETHIIDVESAGLGFALSVLRAEQYEGQEISSIQVLKDFGFDGPSGDSEQQRERACVDEIQPLLQKITTTFEEQYGGWQRMNVFERQWVLRDFKKTVGMSADLVRNELAGLLKQGDSDLSTVFTKKGLFSKLSAYWAHQLKLLQGFEKNAARLAENTEIINGWISDLEQLLSLL